MAHNHGTQGHVNRKRARKARYEHYQAIGRREVNKAIKLARHLRKHLFDYAAEDVYQTLSASVRDQAQHIVEQRRQLCNGIQAGG